MASAKQSSPKQHKEVSVNKNEDPRKRKRTVPMEVLSFGYSRTGTMSTFSKTSPSANANSFPSNESGLRNSWNTDMALGNDEREHSTLLQLERINMVDETAPVP